MRKALLSIAAVFTIVIFNSCQKIQDSLPTGGSVTPSEEQMTSALKEALTVGSGWASDSLHLPDAYLNNARFHIPLPPEAQTVESVIASIPGGQSYIDNAVTSINHAAEDAAVKAKPIFVNAITSMSLSDAKDILLGTDTSATHYFRGATSSQLFSTFEPEIKTSLDKVNATKYWKDLADAYNSIPLVNPINADLPSYTTGKGLQGLFLKLSDEEKNIRNNLNSRLGTSANLQSVFDWALKNKPH